MKVTEMTKQHLVNRISFFERKLANAPGEQHYMGNSIYAEDAVESENIHNKIFTEKIVGHIKYMKRILKSKEVIIE